MKGTPTVTMTCLFGVQICVPSDWTDEQVLELAEKEYPCGTEDGWRIRREGSPLLDGQPERVQCADDPGMVHIMLDA